MPPDMDDTVKRGSSFRADAKAPSPVSAAPAEIVEGAVLIVPHPFLWEKTSVPSDDPEGPYSVEIMSWRPGVSEEFDYSGGVDLVAHAMGAQILTVVSVHKPGRFPTRVFYTRRWRDPRGKEFGKGALRIKTVSAFKRLARGYRGDFDLEPVAGVAGEEQGSARSGEEHLTSSVSPVGEGKGECFRDDAKDPDERGKAAT